LEKDSFSFFGRRLLLFGEGKLFQRSKDVPFFSAAGSLDSPAGKGLFRQKDSFLLTKLWCGWEWESYLSNKSLLRRISPSCNRDCSRNSEIAAT